MREVRLYQPGNYEPGQVLELSPEVGQHVGVVLRMQPGEHITLFCGDNQEFTAIIKSVKKKQVTVFVERVQVVNRESPLKIQLAQAISKGDRMEFVMQKSVELGVASIVPIISDRCVVKLDKERIDKKLNQWQSIVISACEQSGRTIIPKVNEPMLFDHYVQKSKAMMKFIVHPDATQHGRDYSLLEDIALVIGPEGGLTEAEVQLAYQYQFLPLSLGPRILRTETAAITVLSMLQAMGGDL